MKVRGVDNVHVDDPERADAGRREVQRGGRAEAAGAQEQDLAFQQPLLSCLSDLGEQQVPVIAGPLFRAQGGRGDPCPPFVLPAPKPAGHGDDVGVSELFERLGCER